MAWKNTEKKDTEKKAPGKKAPEKTKAVKAVVTAPPHGPYDPQVRKALGLDE
jgi:hypothetical protein